MNNSNVLNIYTLRKELLQEIQDKEWEGIDCSFLKDKLIKISKDIKDGVNYYPLF